MPKFHIDVIYRGKEGYTVEAADAEEAKRLVLNGDAGEHTYDEYIEREFISVYAENEDEPLIAEEVKPSA